jgi:hypothetical protein
MIDCQPAGLPVEGSRKASAYPEVTCRVLGGGRDSSLADKNGARQGVHKHYNREATRRRRLIEDGSARCPKDEPCYGPILEKLVSGQNQGLTARSIAVEADGFRRAAGLDLLAPVQRGSTHLVLRKCEIVVQRARPERLREQREREYMDSEVSHHEPQGRLWCEKPTEP